MKLRLYTLILAAFLFANTNSSAQSVKQVIIEHFTNTVCSICSNPNKNPALITNLAANPQVLHVSYHPSSPYPTCQLNQHNPEENDGRTEYYDVFGGTPRLVVQGVLNPNSIAFGSNDVFAQYLDQSASVEISIAQSKVTDEMITANITITTLEENDFENPKLLVAVAEELVNYNAPNGESQHHNVFRKAMTNISGDEITLPAVGESITLSYTVDHNAEWNFSRMFAYAILNEADTRAVIQAQAANPNDNVSSTSNPIFNQLALFPNPVSNSLTVDLNAALPSTATLYDVQGKLLMMQEFTERTQFDMTSYADGIYMLTIENEEGKVMRKVIKQ